MVQHRGRHAHQTAAAAAPRDEAARHQRADVGDLRRGADRPGDVHRTLHRHSRRGAGDLQDMASHAARARDGAGKSPRNASEDLFQERERVARGLAQAQHRRAASLLQLQAGHQAPDDRDRRRTVGRFDRLRSQTLRHRPASVHGQGQLRPETLPPSDDEHLGRGVRGVALDADQLGARSAGTRPALLGKPRTGDLGGRGNGPAPSGGYAILPGQRPEPRGAAPDGHRTGGREADGDGRCRARHGDRMLRRRQQLRRHRVPVPAKEPHRREENPRDRRGARRVPETHARRIPVRLRRRGRIHAPAADVHAGA